MTIFTKIKWVASVLLVFFIVLITNIIDRDNFNRLSYSVTTIYEDRIVASDLIFEMSRIIHDLELAIVSDESKASSHTDATYRALEGLTERYNQTKFTEKEKLVFSKLQDELKVLEQKELKSEGSRATQELLSSINKIDQYLYDLSKIQLQEGQRQVLISDKAKDAINLFTQAEIIFLVVMAILIQIIILYKPKEFSEK